MLTSQKQTNKQWHEKAGPAAEKSQVLEYGILSEMLAKVRH